MDRERLATQLSFAMEVEQLKQVFRQSLLLGDRRRENDAEHSWHICLMAMLLVEHAAEEVDVLKVLKMLLIHDVVEIDAGDTFKLIYAVGEIISGDILSIGNPNARVRIEKPLHQFMDDWCQQGPSHHIAMGIGDHSAALETFAESIQFRSVRV